MRNHTENVNLLTATYYQKQQKYNIWIQASETVTVETKKKTEEIKADCKTHVLPVLYTELTYVKCIVFVYVISSAADWRFCIHTLCLRFYVYRRHVQKLDAPSHTLCEWFSSEAAASVKKSQLFRLPAFFGGHQLTERLVYLVWSSRYVQPDTFACSSFQFHWHLYHLDSKKINFIPRIILWIRTINRNLIRMCLWSVSSFSSLIVLIGSAAKINEIFCCSYLISMQLTMNEFHYFK